MIQRLKNIKDLFNNRFRFVYTDQSGNWQGPKKSYRTFPFCFYYMSWSMINSPEIKDWKIMDGNGNTIIHIRRVK